MEKRSLLDKDMVVRESKRLLVAIGGTLSYAIGINLFVVPLHLYTGGVMGICQLIRTLLVDYMHLPLHNFDIAGLIYYIINVPLFVVAIRKMGRKFFTKTVICVTTMTVFLSLVPIPRAPILDDVLASCLIAGIFCGVGIGLTLRMGGSDGGMDIVGVLLIRWKKDFSVGKINLIVNTLLYAVCLFLFDVPTVIYSVIYASVSALAVDRVHAQNINVEVNIVSKHVCDEMLKEIFRELERGITRWDSTGVYTGENAVVLYILLSKYEVGRLKSIVRKYDREAFIVVNEGVNVDGHFIKKL